MEANEKINIYLKNKKERFKTSRLDENGQKRIHDYYYWKINSPGRIRQKYKKLVNKPYQIDAMLFVEEKRE